MLYKILMCLFILIFVFSLKANTDKYSAERLLTDFNGVAYNGTNVLCYGNWGVITYSEDQSETWKQTNIGDEHNIIKIVNINNIFIGITKSDLLKSIDNGVTWEFKKIDTMNKILNVAVNNNNIFVNTSNKVIKCNLELDIDDDFDMKCNTESELYKEIAINEEYLFAILQNEFNHNLILKYNLETSKIDTIDLLPLNLCSACDKLTSLTLSNLKNEANNISLFIENYRQNGFGPPYTLIYTEDNGDSWNIANQKISVLAKTYKYDSLSKTFKYINHASSNYLNIYLLELEFNEIIDSASQKKLSKPQKNLRVIGDKTGDADVIREYIRIDVNTLICVGKNKTIAISKNKGENWDFISNIEIIRPNNSFYKMPFIVKDSNFQIPTQPARRAICFSNNNLITAIPQLYDSNSYISKGGISSYYFNNDGTGIVNYRNTDSNSANQLFTKDYGNSYEKRFSETFLNKIFYDYSGLNNQDTILFYNTQGLNTHFYRFKKDFNFIDSVVLDSVSGFWLNKTEDGSNILYGFGYLGKNYNSDSAKFMTNEYILFISHNNGANWEYKSIENQTYSGAKYFDNSIYLVRHNSLESKIIIYNLHNNNTDSILFNNSYSLTENPINKYDAKIIISFKDGTFYTIENLNNQYYLDSFHIKSILKNWKQYNPFKINTIDDILMGINIHKNVMYLETGVRLSESPLSDLNINIVRLTPKTHTSIENEIETPTQMYVNKPYPLPARNTVNAEVYWDLRHDIDVADIGIFNSMGSRVGDRENININKTAEYKGIVSWDCSGMPAGVYFIQIRHGNAVKSIPVVVGK